MIKWEKDGRNFKSDMGSMQYNRWIEEWEIRCAGDEEYCIELHNITVGDYSHTDVHTAVTYCSTDDVHRFLNCVIDSEGVPVLPPSPSPHMPAIPCEREEEIRWETSGDRVDKVWM